MQGTDNSLLCEKVQLRAEHTPAGPQMILDAFGGFGVVWQEVSKATGRNDLQRVGIDKEARSGCVRGDNRKWLKGMNLKRYGVIDLDAYGVPFDQVEILFQRQYKGVVFFTMIQSVMGQMPAKLLRSSGITRDMQRKCPTLYGQIGWQLWLDWLANNGVRKVWHRSKDRKHYGCFVLT